MLCLCEWVCTELGQSLAFVCCLNPVSAGESSHMSGHMGLTSLFVCVSTLHSSNVLTACVHVVLTPFSAVVLVSLSAHFSVNSFLRMWQRCSWLSSGRLRRTVHGWTLNSPRSDALWQDIPVHSMEKKLLWEKRHIFFFKNKHLITENSSGNALKLILSTQRHTEEIPKRSRDERLLMKWRTVLTVTAGKAIALIWPMCLSCPVLGTFVLTLGRCIYTNKVRGKCGLVWWSLSCDIWLNTCCVCAWKTICNKDNWNTLITETSPRWKWFNWICHVRYHSQTFKISYQAAVDCTISSQGLCGKPSMHCRVRFVSTVCPCVSIQAQVLWRHHLVRHWRTTCVFACFNPFTTTF